MSRASRSKGTAGERELVQEFKAAGFDVWRTPNSGAFNHAPGDINGVPGWHIEGKRQETLKIELWWEQAVEDCPPDKHPVVVFRRSRKPWKVVLLLNDWLEMLTRVNDMQTQINALEAELEELR